MGRAPLHLPNALVNYLASDIGLDEVRLEFEGIQLGLRGNLKARGINVVSEIDDGALLRIEGVEAILDPWSVLIRRPQLRALSWSRITAICPASSSPGGFRRTWLESGAGGLTMNGSQGTVQPFFLRIADSSIEVRGNFSLPGQILSARPAVLERRAVPDSDPVGSPFDPAMQPMVSSSPLLESDLKQHYVDLAGRVLAFFEDWTGADSLQGYVLLTTPRSAVTDLKISINSGEVRREVNNYGGDGWESLEVNLGLRFDRRGWLLIPGEATILGLRLGSLEFNRGTIKVGREFLLSGNAVTAEGLMFSGEDLVFKDWSLDVLHAGLQRQTFGWEMEGEFWRSGQSLQFGLRGSGLNLPQWATVRGSLKPDLLWKDVPLVGNTPLARATFADPINLSVEAEWTYGQTLLQPDLSFDLSTGVFDLAGLPGRAVRARGHFSAGVLVVESFRFLGADYELGGSYVRNLNEGSFRTRMQGTLRPADLNALFESWWSDLWEDFDFFGSPPFADFDISGTFRGPERGLVFGYAEIGEFRFRGVSIDRFSGKIRALPSFFELFDLEVMTPQGEAFGAYAQTYNRARQAWRSLRLDLSTNLPVSLFPLIFGEELEEMVGGIEAELPPQLSVSGTLVNSLESDLQALHGLLISGRFPSWAKFYGMKIDEPRFRLEVGRDAFRLPELNFQIGGGQGTAQIDWASERQNKLSFQVKVTDAHFREAVQAVDFIREMPVLGELDPKLVSANDSRLNFELTGDGDPEDWASFSGHGRMDLRDPDLARLRLLGAFSRALESTLLPIGSFQFRVAAADLVLEPGKVHVSDFRMEGPSTRVEAEGYVRLPDGRIDFDVRAFPFQATRIPLIHQVTQILNPLGHILEFRLWGDIAQPSWRFRVDPRNIFRSSEAQD